MRAAKYRLVERHLGEKYTYDAVGNRLSSLGASPFTYNTSNELTSRPGATYTYDANGNTLTKTDSAGRTSYSWDFENRLISVTLPGTGGTVNFKYDPFGRRIQKASAAASSVFVYDGDNLIEELDATGSVVARYTHALGIDEPLAMNRSGRTHFYQADGLGSITSLSNASGGFVASDVYDSFGNLTFNTGNVTNPFRYTAREFDTETGLYYYRARYYDSSSGRFLSEDSSRFASGVWNFFGYVENSPISYNDPTGHLKREGDFACCNARNVDTGIAELERVLNSAEVKNRPVFKKYRECLREKAFPEETVQCASKLDGCGSFFEGNPGIIRISPLGSLGRKGSCGPVASTLLHELVHNCYFRDIGAPPLSRVGQQKEANCAECELFGWNCFYCRHPEKAPLD